MSDPLPDFTGHWKQVKNENADGYLKMLGFPFPIRRLAVPAMGKSTDIIKQAGDLQVVTTINVKGSWTRRFIVGKEVNQKNAEGDDCLTTAWWDDQEKEFPGKMIHKSKLVGAKRGVSESWRWYDDGLMVIKSIVYLKKKNNQEAWMLWYFESIEPVRNEAFLSAKAKMKQITKEQRQIQEVTEAQTRELTEAMKDLSTIQQKFVLEMLSVKEKKKDPAAAASKWKKKAKGETETAGNPAEAAAGGSTNRSEEETFYDCDDLTEAQAKVFEEKAAKVLEKETKSFDKPEESSLVGEPKMFLCFPVQKSVKRLPTIVQSALSGDADDEGDKK